MAKAESKNVKVARKGQRTKQTIGTCTCGGDLIWAKVFASKGRMRAMCDKCGAIQQ